MDKTPLTDEQFSAIKDLAVRQIEFSLAALDASEHMLALEFAVCALDSRAKEIFEKQLEVERSKNRKRREELHRLLLKSDGAASATPN